MLAAAFAIAGLPQGAQYSRQEFPLFPVRVGGKSGYIDKTGKIVWKWEPRDQRAICHLIQRDYAGCL